MYIDINDLKTLLPETELIDLSNDDSKAGVIDVVVVTAVIIDACELIDGYLRGRYTLPLPAPTPSIIKQIAKQLTRYGLYTRRPEGFELPDAVKDDRKNAMKILENIRDGLVSIGVVQTGQILSDDGEFHARVRASRNNTNGFSAELLDKY